MKLTCFLLLGCLLHAAAGTLGQNVSLDFKDAPVKAVFKSIKKQTGYTFLADGDLLKAAGNITVKVENTALTDALDACFANEQFTYSISGKIITLKNKPQTADLSQGLNTRPVFSSEIPPITVRGRITNENGEPVVASVIIKGTNRGTTSNTNGEFALNNVDDKAVLIITATNIETISVNTKPELNISVKTASSSLNEVVVNKGYYSETKKLSTGNVSRVDSKTIEKQPVTNVLNSLQGRMPGVQVSQTTGIPGGAVNIQIRGRNSLNSESNLPLYIIDGVAMVETRFFESDGLSQRLNMVGYASPFNTLSPNDIEGIEVLKDADATAIYGSRGANGVILITTKKAKKGKTSLNINLNSGIGKVTRKMDVLNTQQYVEMRKEAFANDGVTPESWNAYDLLVWDTTKYTDWQERLLGGTAKTTNGQLSLSGGNNNTQFLVSGNYSKETTVYPGDFSFKRGGILLSITHTSANNKFNARFSGNYTGDRSDLFNEDLTQKALSTPPNIPDLIDDKAKLLFPEGVSGNSDHPYAFLKRKYNTTTNNLLGSADISYEILSGLKIRSTFGFNHILRDEIQVNPSASRTNLPGSNFRNSKITNWIIEPQVSYNNDLGKHSFNALVGSSLQNNLRDASFLNATGFTSDEQMENMRAATNVKVEEYTNAKYKYAAVFGRFNYAFSGKYILNLTGRRDGSSRFGTGRRFAYFGAVGAAWVFSEEKLFTDDLRFLSFGKLRASYGSTGSDQIGDYKYLETWYNERSYNGITTLLPSGPANPDFRWERNKKLEISVDLGFWKDRIVSSISYYRNRSDNQLVGFPLPPSIGFTTIMANFNAIAQNSGIEVQLNAINLRGRSFSWSTAFNLTLPENKLVEYADIENSPFKDIYQVGKSLFIKNNYHFVGVDPLTGIYQLEDVNKDGSISAPADYRFSKEISQRYYGGFLNSFQYKGVQLDVFFQFVKQTGYNYMRNFSIPGLAVNQPVEVMGRWRKSGDVADIQKFISGFNSAFFPYFNASNSDKTIVDASFIRLKNISLSYQLPASVLQKIKFEGIRVYAQGQNLLTFTNYKGLDPETQSVTNLPPLTTFAFGIQMTL